MKKKINNLKINNMFNPFKIFKNKFMRESEIDDEIEFSFIWYKKMVNGNKTHFTQPFRTKIKAKTREEARKKVTDFALQKMTLVVVDENKFNSSEISQITEQFEKLNEQIKKTIDNLRF